MGKPGQDGPPNYMAIINAYFYWSKVIIISGKCGHLLVMYLDIVIFTFSW